MFAFQSILVLLTTASSFTSGQMPAPESMSRRVTIARILHLDTMRAERVESILNEALVRQRAVRELLGPARDTVSRVVLRGALRAVCEEADRQLVEVLGTDDLDKPINPAGRPGASI